MFMRTTISLDDDVLEIVVRQSELSGDSLSKTVSDLLRRVLNAPAPSHQKNGLVIFKLPSDSPISTTKEVRRLEAEGE